MIQCQICQKQFQPHRPNQVVCGSSSSTCKKKYKYLQRHGKLDGYHASLRPVRHVAADPILAAFISSHPTSLSEVFQDESVPNLGVVRSTGLRTESDLHSVLNRRRVRSETQACPE